MAPITLGNDFRTIDDHLMSRKRQRQVLLKSIQSVLLYSKSGMHSNTHYGGCCCRHHPLSLKLNHALVVRTSHDVEEMTDNVVETVESDAADDERMSHKDVALKTFCMSVVDDSRGRLQSIL